MATTTNNGWTTPNDTDLVRNGASAIRSLGTAIDSSLKKLTYTNITPSYGGTGWSFGSTGYSADANWAQTGKTVFFDGTITAGTSITAGSGAFSVVLPVNSNTGTTEFTGTGMFYDASTGDYYPCEVRISNTYLSFYLLNSAGTYLKAVEFNTTNKPVTIAQNDQFIWSVVYQGV
jgi:hypothetical protein